MRKQLLTFNQTIVLGFTLCATGLLSGCAESYNVDSNISKSRWNDYFKAGEVELYSRQQLESQAFERLGLVSGESCQKNSTLPPPDPAEARTGARRQAADLGANGILDMRCVADSEPQPGCLASLSCYGEAIRLTDRNGN